MIDPAKITAPTITEQPPTEQEREAYKELNTSSWAHQWPANRLTSEFRFFRLAVAYGRALQAEENPVRKIKAYRFCDTELEIPDALQRIAMFHKTLNDWVYFNKDEVSALLDIQPLPKTPEQIQSEKDAEADEAAWRTEMAMPLDNEKAYFLAGRKSARAEKGGAK